MSGAALTGKGRFKRLGKSAICGSDLWSFEREAEEQAGVPRPRSPRSNPFGFSFSQPAGPAPNLLEPIMR